eukprot:RCo003361
MVGDIGEFQKLLANALARAGHSGLPVQLTRGAASVGTGELKQRHHRFIGLPLLHRRLRTGRRASRVLLQACGLDVGDVRQHAQLSLLADWLAANRRAAAAASEFFLLGRLSGGQHRLQAITRVTHLLQLQLQLPNHLNSQGFFCGGGSTLRASGLRRSSGLGALIAVAASGKSELLAQHCHLGASLVQLRLPGRLLLVQPKALRFEFMSSALQPLVHGTQLGKGGGMEPITAGPPRLGLFQMSLYLREAGLQLAHLLCTTGVPFLKRAHLHSTFGKSVLSQLQLLLQGRPLLCFCGELPAQILPGFPLLPQLLRQPILADLQCCYLLLKRLSSLVLGGLPARLAELQHGGPVGLRHHFDPGRVKLRSELQDLSLQTMDGFLSITRDGLKFLSTKCFLLAPLLGLHPRLFQRALVLCLEPSNPVSVLLL